MTNKLSYLLSTLLVLTISFAHATEKTEQLPTLAPVLKRAMPAIVNVAVQGITPGSLPSTDDDEEATT